MDELMQLSFIVLGSASKRPGGRYKWLSRWMAPQDAFLREKD